MSDTTGAVSVYPPKNHTERENSHQHGQNLRVVPPGNVAARQTQTAEAIMGMDVFSYAVIGVKLPRNRLADDGNEPPEYLLGP